MIEENLYVAVYRNLHNGMFSIKCVKRNKVIAWKKDFKLINCNFKVRKSGRLKVLETKNKNVHAFVYGFYTNEEYPNENSSTRIKYNPYISDFFFNCENNSRIDYSEEVYFKNGSEIYAKI
jgi:hypothetical protein